MIFKKKKKVELNDEDAIEAVPPVYLKGEKIGTVLSVRGKEIANAEHMEIIIRFDFGTGAEKMMRDIIAREGIQIGNDIIQKGVDNIEPDDNYVLEASDDDRKYR